MQDADEVIQKASLARIGAVKEHQRLMEKMATLDLQVPTIQQQPLPKDTITGMNDALVKVLEEMKSSTYVNPEHVAQSEAIMLQLTAGLGQVAQLARLAASQRLPEDSGGAKEMTADPKKDVVRVATESELSAPPTGKTRAKFLHEEEKVFSQPI